MSNHYGKDLEIQSEADRKKFVLKHELELIDLVENATLGLHWVDSHGMVKWANRFELNLLGYSPSEYIGQPIANFHADSDVINNILQRLLNNEELHNVPARMLCKNGSIKHVLINSNVYWKNGKFIHSRCFTRDISDIKNIELLLAERTKLAELRAEISNILANENSFITALQQCTESMVKHLHVSFARIWTLNETAEVLELKASAGRYTHLDGPHSRVKVGDFKIGRIAANKKAHLTNEVQSDPEVGDQAWAIREGMIAFAGYPLILDSQVRGVMAMFAKTALSETIIEELRFISSSIAQWITRKEVEKQVVRQKEWLQVTLQSIGDAVITTDMKGNVTYLNAVAEAICGVKSEEATGEYINSIFNIQNELTKLQFGNPVETVLKSGDKIKITENVFVVSKGKREIPIELNAAPISDAQKAMIGVVLVFHDISDRRMREKQQELLIENATLYRRQSLRAKTEIDCVLDNAHKGACVLNPDWTMKFINELALETLELSRGDVGNQIFWKLLPKEVEQKFTDSHCASLRDKFIIEVKSFGKSKRKSIAFVVYPRDNGEFVIFVS